MELNLLEQKNDEYTFLTKGLSLSYANALRRIFTENVLTLAIEDIEIKSNSSLLYDEILAHRLGLIPLKTDLDTYEEAPEYKDPEELNAKQKVTLTLKAKGPCTVYAKDLKSKDPKIKPVHPEMPIVKLLAGQEVELAAIAIMGDGKKHAKWSPCLAFYRQKPLVNIKKKVENAKEVVDNQPDNVFMIKNNTLVVNNDSILKSNLIEESASLCKPEGAIEIKDSDDELVFTIETWGQLTCKEIMVEGLNKLSAISDEFAKALK